MTDTYHVSSEQVQEAFLLLLNHAQCRFAQKGDKPFTSSSEYLQAIREELIELSQATDVDGKDGKIWELLDIAWACLFAIASHRAGGIKDD